MLGGERFAQVVSRPSPTASFCAWMTDSGTRRVSSVPCAWLHSQAPATAATACYTANTTTRSKRSPLRCSPHAVILSPYYCTFPLRPLTTNFHQTISLFPSPAMHSYQTTFFVLIQPCILTKLAPFFFLPQLNTNWLHYVHHMMHIIFPS